MTALAQRNLTECEEVIERNAGEMLSALAEIKSRKLYLETHKTWQDYCEQRWSLTPQHANRKLAAAEVIGAIAESEPMGSLPNERQARELSPLKAEVEKMAEAWEEAVKESDGKPTAKAVQNAVNKMTNVHYCRFRDCGLSFSHPVKHCSKCSGHYTGYIHVCQSKVEPPVEVEPIEVEVIDVCPTCGQVIPVEVAS